MLLIRIASTAVATRLLGGTKADLLNALSNAWIDGGALRTYRHAPNTGSRKSWAAGDATSRAVRHALFALKGEMGYPSALTAQGWGFQDVLFRGHEVKVPAQGFGTYVMEHVLFKISFPAEFHAQTAVEAAVTLHPQIVGRLEEIERIVIETQESGKRIIDKTGPLANPADRDHCIQYMTAVGLLKGGLTAGDYEDDVAADPRLDALRAKMESRGERGLHPRLPRSGQNVPSATRCRCGSATAARRSAWRWNTPSATAAAAPRASRSSWKSSTANLRTRLPARQADTLLALCADAGRLGVTPVHRFMDLFVV